MLKAFNFLVTIMVMLLVKSYLKSTEPSRVHDIEQITDEQEVVHSSIKLACAFHQLARVHILVNYHM